MQEDTRQKPETSGFKMENLSRKDYLHERVFGSSDAVREQDIKPIGGMDAVRKMNLPPVFQGAVPSCVSCSVTWVRQYFDAVRNGTKRLSWPFLAKLAETANDGATPSSVLEPARKVGICEWDVFGKGTVEEELNAASHQIGSYYYLSNTSRSAVYSALLNGPVMIGVEKYDGIGPHMMVALDVNDDGCFTGMNWWKDGVQDEFVLPKDTPIVFACSFSDEPPLDSASARIPMPHYILQEIMNAILGKTGWKRVILSALVAAAAVIAGDPTAPSVVPGITPIAFGSSGVAGKFRTTLSSSISNTASSIAVSSLTLASGEVIGAAGSNTLTFPTYLTINPGSSTDEDVECWGLTTGTLTFTGCVRGLSSIGSNTTSTVTNANFAHSAGETIIQSNTPFFFNRFLDNFTNQTSTGTKTFVNNRVDVGDDSTNTAKFIYFPVGQGAEPYFKIVGPGAGFTTSSFYFSQDGSSDLQLNTSGTTVGASTTRAIGITDGLIHVQASSTDSDNGGFLSFSGAGRIFWDIATFIARAITWTGNHIFTGTVTLRGNATSTGDFAVRSPTSTFQAANKGYVDDNVQMGTASGTTGVQLLANRAVYVSATNTLFYTDTAAATSSYQFVGFTTQSVSSSASSINIATPGGVLCGFTGLNPGYTYYLNGANGNIATTGTTFETRVGRSMTSQCLQILNPKFVRRGLQAITGTGDTFVETGFYPAYVKVWAAASQTMEINIPDVGASWGDDSNIAVFATGTAGGVSPSMRMTTSSAFHTQRITAGSPILLDGTISSKTATGFTLTVGTFAAGSISAWQLRWEAYSE